MEKLDALCCVGSLISLTSKSEIRYEGELFTLDTEKSTIVLKDVRSFGTEGRGTNNLQIPSSSTVYEYIIFRNTDIKDLSVVAFPGISNGTIKDVQEVVCLSERSHDRLSGNSLDICLGWPVSPHALLQIQAVPNWWQWPCPVASLGSYGISPNSLLASLPAAEKRRANTCFWREQQDASVSNFQEKLSIFEQVPHVISSSQNLGLTQNFSALNQGFAPSHQTFQSNPLVQREESSFDSSQACLSRQPPLLPLPSQMSEVQHRSPIMECKSFTSCETARKPRISSHTGPQTSICQKESTSSHCDEVAHFANLDISKEFDFAAMNEQFNKKEIWNEIELNKVEGILINGNESDGSQTYLNTATTSSGLSRKAKFVDNFFDPSLSEKEGCGDNRSKAPNISKQSQIDAETFGMSSLPKKRHRLRRGSLWSRQQISIQKHHIPTL